MSVSPFPDYAEHDGLGLAALLRSGEVSSAELVEAAITRIEASAAGAMPINAVVHRDFARARTLAVAASGPERGPFFGVPYLLKDLLANDQGTMISQGSRFFAGQIATHDSELVRRYKAAGLIPLGKTNTPELGVMPVTEPLLHGPTRNPWNRDHTVGGSSGGAAAAVAAGLVPMAHASDGGGSIRIPASCCGVFGLKPTRGRSPLGPDLGEAWHGLAVEHAVTRSVRDSAALLDLMVAADEGAPYTAPVPERPFLEEVGRAPGRLRIAFTTASLLGKSVDPEVAALTRAVAELCRRLGHDVEEQAPPVDRPAVALAYLTIVAAEVAAELQAGAAALGKPLRAEGFEPPTWFLAQIGSTLSAAELASAVRRMHQTGREMARWFRRHDVLLTPVLSAPPPRIGALAPRPVERAALRLFRALPEGAMSGVMRRALPALAEQPFEFAAFTALANLTGQPAMSVPLSWTSAGLPCGAHFVGRFGEDATLLRLAAQLEQAQPWAGRRPPSL